MVVFVSLVTVLISSFLLFNFQRRQLIYTAQSAAEALSNTVEAALQHAMIEGDWRMVKDVADAVVTEKAVDRLRILDPEGVIGFSSLNGEVGRRVEITDPDCQYCHVGDAPTKVKSVLLTAETGRQVLLSVNTIHNQPECQTCHHPEDRVLGFMLVETPLTGVNDQVKSGFWATGLLAAAAFVLLVGLIVPALDRFVNRPVEELSKGVAEISAGNLDHLVDVPNRDELGDLAQAFNEMRQQLKIYHAEMKQRELELATLNEVALSATQLLDLEDILTYTLDTMVLHLGVSTGMIFLWDEAEERFSLRASRGIMQDQIEEIDRRRRAGLDITKKVAETGKELLVTNMALDARFDGIWDQLSSRSYVNLPLISRGTVVGVMGLVTHPGGTIREKTVEFLKAAGREIGIAIDNALLLEDMRRREHRAVTLYSLGTKISASLALNEVLDAVAKSALELLDADVGVVGLLDERSQEVVIEAAAGKQTGFLKGMSVPVCQQSPGRALVEGHAVVMDRVDLNQPAFHRGYSLEEQGIASFLAVPLQRGGRYVGLVEVMTRQRRRFLQRDVQLLTRLANHVVVAIENAQLYRQLRHMAELEERDRLAREMHDHLAQSLGYLNIRASMTEELLSSGAVDDAQESLLELKRAAKVVYTDVREDIFNLRTAVSDRINFFVTLKRYLAEYETHYGVTVHLSAEHDDEIEFTSEVAGQLLRIIQEALTNVRKHACASAVWIKSIQENDRVCFTIEDDGQGFLPSEVEKSGQHYGLEIMRERAESVGGSLEIFSVPGVGTRILIWLPVCQLE